MNPLWALVLIVVLASIPSVLFLLFWRFLVVLRDDALIETLRLEHALDVTEPVEAATRNTGIKTRPSRTIVTCPACGTKTIAGDESCILCEHSLA